MFKNIYDLSIQFKPKNSFLICDILLTCYEYNRHEKLCTSLEDVSVIRGSSTKKA